MSHTATSDAASMGRWISKPRLAPQYTCCSSAKVCVPVLLEEGINYIRLENRSYQAGELAIDQLIVTKEKERAKTYCAANGELFPRGNGCWEGLPQRENDTSAYQGRTVKYSRNPRSWNCYPFN